MFVTIAASFIIKNINEYLTITIAMIVLCILHFINLAFQIGKEYQISKSRNTNIKKRLFLSIWQILLLMSQIVLVALYHSMDMDNYLKIKSYYDTQYEIIIIEFYILIVHCAIILFILIGYFIYLEKYKVFIQCYNIIRNRNENQVGIWVVHKLHQSPTNITQTVELSNETKIDNNTNQNQNQNQEINSPVYNNYANGILSPYDINNQSNLYSRRNSLGDDIKYYNDENRVINVNYLGQYVINDAYESKK
jgi:hypothetical protein